MFLLGLYFYNTCRGTYYSSLWFLFTHLDFARLETGLLGVKFVTVWSIY